MDMAMGPTSSANDQQSSIRSTNRQSGTLQPQGFGYQAPAMQPAVDERLARGLGWFSVGIGLWGFVSPGLMAQVIGVPNDDGNRTILRAFGTREIAQGIGILTNARPTGWLWTRVIGDAMDLSYLTWALSSGESQERPRTATALASVIGVTIPDVMTSMGMSRNEAPTSAEVEQEQGMLVRKAITIRRPIDELYRFWHNFENLPQIMSNLASVRVTGERHSHWVAKAPGGTAVEWDAEIVDERSNEMIAWRSLPGSQIPNAGAVFFRPAPGNRGTEIMVDLRFDAPGGRMGRSVAKLFGKDPAQQIATDLRRFKQLMETGEIVVSEATLQSAGLIQRPARPPAGVPHEAAAA